MAVSSEADGNLVFCVKPKGGFFIKLGGLMDSQGISRETQAAWVQEEALGPHTYRSKVFGSFCQELFSSLYEKLTNGKKIPASEYHPQSKLPHKVCCIL